MRRRKKHTNGCLLRLLGIFVGTGFIMLCIAFGLYMVSEKPQIYEEDTSRVVVNKKEEAPEHEEALAEVEDTLLTEEVAEEEESSLQTEELVEGSKDLSLETVETSEATKTEETSKSSETRETEETLHFEEVPVYDTYILKLDENILDEVNGVFKDGQIDYRAFISKMFKNLSLADQVKLLNMILSKVQGININEVWNMVKDGVSEEDSIKLQEMVQSHFTLEELDELYSYYESMEIAESMPEE